METKELMQKRFHEIDGSIKKIMAGAADLEAAVDKAQAKVEKAKEELKAAGQAKNHYYEDCGLYELSKERSAIANALQGKTGPSPA